jgi:two-component system LytT family response regulator
MLKAILVDDERSGREMLAAILKGSFGQRIEVSALCKNVSEGLEALATHSPDVIFLDVEMPNESGFELVEKANPLTASVVFVTAYNQHAVHAFRVNALDYLLKPVQHSELEQVISRLEKIKAQGAALTQQEIIEKLFSVSHNSGKVGLPSLNGMIFVEVAQIIRCEADDNYSVIHVPGYRHVISRTLKSVEETLKHYNFLRVHKSHLVNLDKVVKYQKHEGGTLILTDNAEIPLSRQAKEELERRLLIL